MRELLRPLLLMGAVLAIPIVPFALFGAEIEAWVRAWSQQPGSAAVVALGIFALLAGDILLPVPSSLVSTMGGWRLGWIAGTGVSWLGLTAGACLGFALARRWGQRLAIRLSKPDQLGRFAHLAARFGPAALVLCRGVPVFAEASVLWTGMHGMTWRKFLLPVALSNLGIALAYSAFGEFAAAHEWLPLALGVSIGLPVLFALFLSRLR